jgi:hypothetical protein
MNELDQRISELRAQNFLVAKSFQITSSESEALKLAVVTLADAMVGLVEEFERPRKFEWEITGNLAICPECAKITELYREGK